MCPKVKNKEAISNPLLLSYSKVKLLRLLFSPSHYGSFTLTWTNLGTDSDSDSKPDGYIVLCRIYSQCTDSDLDPNLSRTGFLEFESESVPQSLSANVNEPLCQFVKKKQWLHFGIISKRVDYLSIFFLSTYLCKYNLWNKNAFQ